jgi:hypothetical protein
VGTPRGRHVLITPRRRLRTLAPAATALALGVAVTGAAAVPALAHGPDDGGGGYHDDGGWDGDNAGGGDRDGDRDDGDRDDGDRDGDRDGDHDGWGGDKDAAPPVPQPPAPEPAPPAPEPAPPAPAPPAPEPAPPAPEPAPPAPEPAPEPEPEPAPAIATAIAPLESNTMSALGKVPQAATNDTDEKDVAAGVATGVALAAAAGFGALLVRSRRDSVS